MVAPPASRSTYAPLDLPLSHLRPTLGGDRRLVGGEDRAGRGLLARARPGPAAVRPGLRPDGERLVGGPEHPHVPERVLGGPGRGDRERPAAAPARGAVVRGGGVAVPGRGAGARRRPAVGLR